MNTTRALIVGVLCASCAQPREGCELAGEPRALHDDVREASGIALSRSHGDVLWTHNDSEGGAAIFAIDLDGNPLARVELAGAHNRDWEDIAVARCPDGGPDGDCVFVADIGDNRASREGIGVWIVPEPDPAAPRTVDAVFLRMHYPDGPRDAEALVVLGDGSILIVSKGRQYPISVYRSAPLAWPAEGSPPVVLERIQSLTDRPADLPLQVTGASLGGRGVIAVRTYARLQFYALEESALRPLLTEPFALDSLGEPQGEGVAMGTDGRVWLVSEAGPQAIAPRLTTLRCRLP